MATLYHWDLPQAFQDEGGWPNRALVDRFNDYARVCFKEFGDRVKIFTRLCFFMRKYLHKFIVLFQVKYWITFNEPICTCWLGYGNGVHAPGIKDPLSSPFQAAHTLLLAHAKAYRMYEKEFKPQQKGAPVESEASRIFKRFSFLET